MGLLINGQWHSDWYDTESTGGEFIRQDAQFRHRIGSADFPAEAGRYHLFVSLACPWAHRTLIFRVLKNLEPLMGVTVVEPRMGEDGWVFAARDSSHPLPALRCLHELYTTAEPGYSGRVTVPVLWDTRTHRIVNNESAEIIRMFNTAFNALTGNDRDYYPATLRHAIDAINDTVYHRINNGVYKAGFATAQSVYEKHCRALFATLDALERRLDRQRYLAGDALTEADWRLFTTLIRFDSVYHGHFKTNLRRISDYPNLSNYVRELYQQTGIAGTVDFDHIKTHYYGSHTTINPTAIVPIGPAIDYRQPHNRHRFAGEHA